MKQVHASLGFLVLCTFLATVPTAVATEIDETCEAPVPQSTKAGLLSTCGPQQLIKGIRCSGSYCKRLDLTCCNFTSRTLTSLQDPPKPTLLYWSQWISEEAPNNMTADVRGFLRSIQCRGSYCDQKSVEYLGHPDIRNTGQCYWSRYFSEEAPNSYQCGTSEFVAGLRCQGSYCDNISIYCCRGEMQPTSAHAGQPSNASPPSLTPLLQQIPKQQPQSGITVLSPSGGIAGHSFTVSYVDPIQRNRFDAVMEFMADLKGARWRYIGTQGIWHPLRVTVKSGSGIGLQGEYSESGMRVQESYNLSFTADHQQLSGTATFVFWSPSGAVTQRNYQVSGIRQ